MKTAKHPTWGRPLKECIGGCNLAGPTELTPDKKLLNRIFEAIHDIGAGEEVPNETLGMIFYLPRVPTVMEMLDHVPFIKAYLKIACEPKTSNGTTSVNLAYLL